MIHFPFSGVETYWWLPTVVAFVISFFTSMAGISGAIVLLPFQMSVLNFTGPSVSPTNLLYNVIAIPGGVYRYFRENRLVWPLTLIIIIGTLPGLILGIFVRVRYLPDPRAFKLFAGLVLLYIGMRLLLDLWQKSGKIKLYNDPSPEPVQTDFRVTPLVFNLRQVGYSFKGEDYYVTTAGLLILSLIVGMIGGVYGIGGGAFIAPFLVTVFKLPVYTVAGAALFGTFLTSLAGVLLYTLLSPWFSQTGPAVRPEWLLGLMFGLGGLIGIYLGARTQKYMPAKIIKAILMVCVLFVALTYIIGFFF